MTSRSLDIPEAENTDIISGIRSALEQVETLDQQRDGSLRTLALVLHRVAAADGNVSADEVMCMEGLLADHASLSRPEAMLTVEIARHCARVADCGCAYEASRRLRRSLSIDERRALCRFLETVAEADGLVSHSEQAAIRQIATEIGVP